MIADRFSVIRGYNRNVPSTPSVPMNMGRRHSASFWHAFRLTISGSAITINTSKTSDSETHPREANGQEAGAVTESPRLSASWIPPRKSFPHNSRAIRCPSDKRGGTLLIRIGSPDRLTSTGCLGNFPIPTMDTKWTTNRR